MKSRDLTWGLPERDCRSREGFASHADAVAHLEAGGSIWRYGVAYHRAPAPEEEPIRTHCPCPYPHDERPLCGRSGRIGARLSKVDCPDCLDAISSTQKIEPTNTEES